MNWWRQKKEKLVILWEKYGPCGFIFIGSLFSITQHSRISDGFTVPFSLFIQGLFIAGFTEVVFLEVEETVLRSRSTYTAAGSSPIWTSLCPALTSSVLLFFHLSLFSVQIHSILIQYTPRVVVLFGINQLTSFWSILLRSSFQMYNQESPEPEGNFLGRLSEVPGNQLRSEIGENDFEEEFRHTNDVQQPDPVQRSLFPGELC